MILNFLVNNIALNFTISSKKWKLSRNIVRLIIILDIQNLTTMQWSIFIIIKNYFMYFYNIKYLLLKLIIKYKNINTFFSCSFLMADQFPDCIGEVDVVSDAENIKKLLKIPYNPKAHISMMIHKVRKFCILSY